MTSAGAREDFVIHRVHDQGANRIGQVNNVGNEIAGAIDQHHSSPGRCQGSVDFVDRGVHSESVGRSIHVGDHGYLSKRGGVIHENLRGAGAGLLQNANFCVAGLKTMSPIKPGMGKVCATVSVVASTTTIRPVVGPG